jgi:glycosyltransferase involved in cell wall biosynthesis
MQILQIIPGSGNSFYCGNCLRDSKYVHALRALGHDVVKVPMYLPLFTNGEEEATVPVFYGAVNIFLKQLWPAFGRAPGWVERLLNSRPVLNLAANMAGSTRAGGLEEMTISMLMGEHGRQASDLDEMIDWIKRHFRPDVIHLSNALLLGLAHRIKEELGTPVVCSLQDEDVWVDAMDLEAGQRVWDLMAEKAEHVDTFLAVSDHYRRQIQPRMRIPEGKLQHLHLGIDLLDYDFAPVTHKPKSIGFLSRLCLENGLDILIDAFIELKKNPQTATTRLILNGGHTRDDAGFIKTQKKKLKKAGLLHEVDFQKDFSEAGRKQFFDQVAVLSVPVPKGEAFGLYLLEAMASGVPVVQPHVGAFPEIISISGGGMTYRPNHPDSLAKALEEVLFDEEKLHRFSEQGRKGVETHFHIHEQARMMVGVYEGIGRQELFR